MINLPLDRPGRFYKGNLHCHSNRSDGQLDPAAMVAAYRDRRYDFIALTDHFWRFGGSSVTDTREWRTANFTTLLGAELHAPQIEHGEQWHILAVGLPLDFAPPASDETGPLIAARAAAVGAFIGIAHPHAYDLTPNDARTIEVAHAVEIHNDTSELHYARGDAWYLCDLLLAEGRRLLAYAADDAHFTHPADGFGSWVQVWAEQFTPEALLAALKAGHYYASEGPEIFDLTITDNVLKLHCSPVERMILTGRGGRQYHISIDITSHTFALDAFAGSYCRVTLVDAAGKRAWSNPIWLPQFHTN